MRRPIANLYSVANLTNFEPLVFSTMQRFFARLDELFTDSGRELDFCQWLQFFTFDVMGEVTFSRRLGFLEKGGDVEEVMENNWKYFRMAAPVSVSLMDKTPILLLSLLNAGNYRTRRCRGWTTFGKTTLCSLRSRKGTLSPISAPRGSRSA